jgi:hypothetical protein
MGKNSPEVRNLSIYKKEAIKKINSDLHTIENSALGSDGNINKVRILSLPEGTTISANHINISNDIARILTYINPAENVHISDILFTTEDYMYDKYVWSRILQTRVEHLAVLIKSLNEICIDDVPTLMNAFPNISEALFIRSGILMKEKIEYTY